MYNFGKADEVVQKILSKEWSPLIEEGSSAKLMYEPGLSESFVNEKVSEENLKRLNEGHHDVTFAKDIEKNENRWKYLKGEPEMIDLGDYLEEVDNQAYVNTGLFYCPPGGFCGWHTNSNSPGPRMYLVWAEEDNKSFFRWKDPYTGEIITKWEKKGWNVNKFVAPVWHTLASWTNRISIGFTPYLENNGIVGTHSCRKESNSGDWSINDNEEDQGIDLRTLRYLLTKDKLEMVTHSKICHKSLGEDTLQLEGGIRYDKAQIKYPGILIRNGKNPKNLKYRMIDGNHRMVKMKNQGIKESKFYVLEYDDIKDHLRPFEFIRKFSTLHIN